jgi:hypothetical protein
LATRWKSKDPADIAYYTVDWGDEFLPANVNIIAATAVLEPQPAPPAPYEAMQIVVDSYTPKTVILLVSGGAALVDYEITTDIDTNTGEHFQTTNILKVRERIR